MAPAIAGLAVVMVASAGMALDVGLHYIDNRQLHAATEAAALAAAMYPDQAQQRATIYLTNNGYDASVIKSVQVGRYCADSSLTAAQRFDTSYALCPGNGASTAVRITTGKASRRFLSRILPNAVIPDISSTATAARIDEAGIGISSGLLNVSNSLLLSVNNLLGALLGIKLNLTAPQIQYLMGGNVDAGLFFDKLAALENKRLGIDTYNDLIQSSVGLQNIAYAAASATSNANTKAALNAFGDAVNNDYKVPLKDLFGLGIWKKMPVGEADRQPGLRAGLNAYQLITFAVQAGPGVVDASDLVKLILPQNTSTVVKLTAVASGPMDRPRFSFGPAGETKVGTSALRLQLLISDLSVNVPLVLNTTINVPVLVDVAAAQAEVTAIDCASTPEQRANTRVSVLASSGLINTYIGNAPANAMTKPMPVITAADITQAQLIDTKILAGLIQVTASARAVGSPVTGQTSTLTFGPGGTGTIGSPSSLGTAVTVGNGSKVGTTITNLVGTVSAGLDVDAKVVGLCIWPLCTATPDTNAIESSVLGVLLPSITTPVGQLVGTTVDPLLDSVLAALGVQVGYATVWATGARCGVPVLV